MLMPSGSSLANLTNLSAAGRIVGCHSRDTISVAAVSLHECPLSSLSFHRRRVTACADSKVQNGRKLRLRSKRWSGQESGCRSRAGSVLLRGTRLGFSRAATSAGWLLISQGACHEHHFSQKVFDAEGWHRAPGYVLGKELAK